MIPAERIARERGMHNVKLARAALENVEYFLSREEDGPNEVRRAGDALSAATAYLAQAFPHLLRALAIRASEPGGEQYVTFFPWGDFEPSGGYVSYGPFTREEAKAHARTLSTDPDEGKIARLERP